MSRRASFGSTSSQRAAAMDPPAGARLTASPLPELS
jgi:hypothetical protein